MSQKNMRMMSKLIGEARAESSGLFASLHRTVSKNVSPLCSSARIHKLNC